MLYFIHHARQLIKVCIHPDAWYKREGLECRKAKPSPGGKFNGKVFNSFSGAEDMVSAIFYLSFVFTIVSLVTCTSCLLVESLVTSRKNVFLKGRVMQRQLTNSRARESHACTTCHEKQVWQKARRFFSLSVHVELTRFEVAACTLHALVIIMISHGIILLNL